MNCTDFLRILCILMDFVHNPYRCGPLKVGMYGRGCVNDIIVVACKQMIVHPANSTDYVITMIRPLSCDQNDLTHVIM